jgi:hypothetical protein
VVLNLRRPRMPLTICLFHRSAYADLSNRPRYDTRLRVRTQEEFMNEYAGARGVRGCACMSGYNPLLEDFANTRFLLT